MIAEISLPLPLAHHKSKMPIAHMAELATRCHAEDIPQKKHKKYPTRDQFNHYYTTTMGVNTINL